MRKAISSAVSQRIELALIFIPGFVAELSAYRAMASLSVPAGNENQPQSPANLDSDQPRKGRVTMRDLRAVLFDMDGLLIDSERIGIRASVAAGRALGYPVDKALALRMLGLTRALRRERYTAAVPGMDFDAFEAQFNARLMREIETLGVAARPGAQELLAWLAEKRIPCVLSTSTAWPMVDARLVKAGLAPYFALRVTGDQVARSKPDPEIFLRAAALAGADIVNCLVLEDSLNGIRAGRATGAVVGMVPDLQPYDESTCGPYCDAVFATLAEVSGWITGS
jgi:HAD superfamily hydrolase (TIGR01509 family)